MRPQESRKTLEPYCEKALELLRGYEFSSFLVGTSTAPGLDEREATRLRRDVNRVVGVAIQDALPGTAIDAGDPQMVIRVDLPRGIVEVTPSPVYVYGRYRKFSREIPQTRWHCRKCRGRGCAECGGTGRVYALTVEDAIAEPFLEPSGTRRTKMHGMGREDVDARMLGSGRPFVLELLEPRRRTLDLLAIEAAINEKHAGVMAVSGLSIVDREAKRLVKSIEPKKTYRVLMESARDLSPGDIEKIRSLDGVTLRQRTPVRVSHRRADKIRERRILRAEAESVDPRHVELKLTTQAGTYVKELITGDPDDGAFRTEPSITALLGADCICRELDVLTVHFFLRGTEPPPPDVEPGDEEIVAAAEPEESRGKLIYEP